MKKYEEIIDNEYIGVLLHPKMSIYDRAAQFAPFSALTGFENAIEETGRLTDRKIELDENEKEELDKKMRFLLNNLSKNIVCKFIYFVKDEKKQGGKYIEVEGIVKKLDRENNAIILKSGKKLMIENILNVLSEHFEI